MTAARGAVRFFFTRGHAASSHPGMDDESPPPQRLTPEEVALLKAARDVLAAAPREADALEFAIEGDRFVIVQGFADDVTAAADAHVIDLQSLVIEKLRDLEEAVEGRLDNQRAWRVLPRTVQRLLAALDAPTTDIPFRIVDIYHRTIALASFVEQDDAIGNDRSASDHPLDADIRRALADAVGSLAPWVRRFPTALKEDDARQKMLARPELYEPVRKQLPDARRLFEAARETGALSEADAERALEPIETAENATQGGIQGQKAGYGAVASAGSLLRAVAGAVFAIQLGALGSALEKQVPLYERIVAFALRAPGEAGRIARGLPDDLRIAVTEGLRRAREEGEGGALPFPLPSRLPTPPALAQRARTADGIPLPPELYIVEELFFRKSDVEDISALAQAKNLKTLQFSIARVKDLGPLSNLKNLENLYIYGCPIFDLLPLINMKSLRALSIDCTGINDLTPLKYIDTLTSLSIDFSPVSDITPLADLVYLTALNLSRTQVADLTPLRGLRNLRSLSLDTTKVSDLTPLRDLINLETLSAWGNDIGDIAPLAALSKLKRLNLSNTRVADVTPLARLVHLTELFLTDTPVSDVRPLASLTSLETLLLPAGADPTPLLHLPALRKRRD